jgi:hypothetical protein
MILGAIPTQVLVMPASGILDPMRTQLLGKFSLLRTHRRKKTGFTFPEQIRWVLISSFGIDAVVQDLTGYAKLHTKVVTYAA